MALDYIHTKEGRVQVKAGNVYDYFLRVGTQWKSSPGGNHLGNTRVVFANNTGTAILLQSDSYFPFGMTASQYAFISGSNQYLFNGKGLQEDVDIGF
jgi:hypothetical protein